MWPRRIAYLLIIWIVLVAILEGGLRLVGFAPPRPAELAPQYSKFVPDDELIWALKSDWRGFELDDTPLMHNSLGFRGREPNDEAAGPRILFLGDSVTYGHHLEESETLPARLQQELAAQSAGPVEVINAGVPGYSTFQSAGQLRRWGERLAPDVVLLGFCLNDVTERYTALATFGGPRFFMMDVDTARGLSWPRRVWLASAIRQALARAFRAAAGRGEDDRLQALWEEPDSEPVAAAWQTALGEIDEIHAETARLGVPLGVVIYPHARQVEMPSGAEAPQQALIAHLERQGIPYLDLLGPLRASPYRMQQLFLDVTHLSPPGAAETARFVAPFVLGTYLSGQEAGQTPAGRSP